MVVPIPTGTMLRHRYLIQRVLGQGGFGRTYLALDQERFNEPCVIKEFTVSYYDDGLVEKSKILFQREASILYQVQHPQIPRFWAAFEDNQRLFLVQDYIEGQTYRCLLSDRKRSGQAFSQSEVLHFLNHMLPVLAYIHDRTIIHRDISPENIILQTQEPPALVTSEAKLGLPVLIDFGAVKEAASHWPLVSAATRVGKVGYAPPEQLQTGRVYPNSDLYALAATSLALLTGKEPQSLLDSQTLTWRWEAYATIHPELGRVLRKMLAVYPGDRYISAQEVLGDLQAIQASTIENTLLSPERSPALLTVSNTTQNRTSGRSQDAAITYSPLAKANVSTLANPIQQSTHSGGTWKLATVAIALVGLGVATPIAWRALQNHPGNDGEIWVSGARMPQSEASRLLESQTNSALRVAPDSNPSTSRSQPPELVQFPAGKRSTVVQGDLPTNALQPYIVEGAEGQILTATLNGATTLINVLRSNQEAVDAAAYQTRSWAGQLPASDRYIVEVTGSGSYSLEIAMSPLARPVQEQTQRITFARGTSGTTVTGQLASKQIRRYLLQAKQGQILALNPFQGKLNLSVIAPGGQRIGGSATHSRKWQGRLPMDGDYVVEVWPAQPGRYALALEIF